jgi:hypothetical protein
MSYQAPTTLGSCIQLDHNLYNIRRKVEFLITLEEAPFNLKRDPFVDQIVQDLVEYKEAHKSEEEEK